MNQESQEQKSLSPNSDNQFLIACLKKADENSQHLYKIIENLHKENEKLKQENDRLKKELIRKDDALGYAVRSLYECARRADYD